jgi:hypothetical protein
MPDVRGALHRREICVINTDNAFFGQVSMKTEKQWKIFISLLYIQKVGIKIKEVQKDRPNRNLSI